jgi:hypothetical protein
VWTIVALSIVSGIVEAAFAQPISRVS